MMTLMTKYHLKNLPFWGIYTFPLGQRTCFVLCNLKFSLYSLIISRINQIDSSVDLSVKGQRIDIELNAMRCTRFNDKVPQNMIYRLIIYHFTLVNWLTSRLKFLFLRVTPALKRKSLSVFSSPSCERGRRYAFCI